MSDPTLPFRAPEIAAELVRRLHAQSPARPLTFMHVCGTHEAAIGRFGLRQVLPPWLRVIAGPGCPVCVCPPADIDLAVRLALDRRAVVATFGDMLRVPGRVSLAEARAQGGDVRVILSAADAVDIARREPDREVVLFAIGFETTACTIAAAVRTARLPNFSVLSAQRLVPPALDALLTLEGLNLDGFLLPGHVLTVTGAEPYLDFCRKSGKPAAVAGFEAVDIVLGLEQLVQLHMAGRADIANAYPRAVRPGGNPAARAAIAEVFRPVGARWRGLGLIPDSGLALQPALAGLDALQRFDLAPDESLAECLPGCRCGDVMIGRLDPVDCPLFAKRCTPATPCGPCMVSHEGTCRSRYLYREA